MAWHVLMKARRRATFRLNITATERIMSENANGNSFQQQMATKAKASDNAERKEDTMVLIIAAITVALVMTGTIGPNFFKSLFF